MKLRPSTTICAALLGAVALSYGAQAAAYTATFLVSPNSEFVSFDFFHGNRIFLKGKTNGHAADILLDSGADRTTVDQELVNALGLKATAAVNIPGAAGSQMDHLYAGVDVAAAGLRLTNLSVHGMDLKPIG